MSKLEEQISNFVDKFKYDISVELDKVRQEAFNDGFLAGVANHKKPTISQFRKDHAEPKDYGEDFAMVVWASSRKKATKLLECDPEFIEEMYVDWGTYELDGEMTVGYVLNRSNNGIYQAWGCWL